MTAPAAAPPTADPTPVLDHGALRQAIMRWFDRHGRELDFRTAGQQEPWGVLVSEVMAQQTQIGRVEERWPTFMAAFPTPASMAAATPADVIREWRGLGYNRRALGLHRAAVAIVAAGGEVPGDLDTLLTLPGVGPYTARAVAAMAFGRRVGAVDVNVRRVVGRIVAGDPSRLTPRALQAEADAIVDPARPGKWTHAVMDLGATICRPARPACPACPARRWCAAATSDVPYRAEPTRSTKRPAVPFEQTSRWLRGRIVDRLRDAPAGAPVALDGALGGHSVEAVAAALAGLARDGIVELDGAGRACLAGAAAR